MKKFTILILTLSLSSMVLFSCESMPLRINDEGSVRWNKQFFENVDWEKVANTVIEYKREKEELEEYKDEKYEEFEEDKRVLLSSYGAGVMHYISMDDDVDKKEKMNESLDVARDFSEEMYDEDLYQLTKKMFLDIQQQEEMSDKELMYMILQNMVDDEVGVFSDEEMMEDLNLDLIVR